MSGAQTLANIAAKGADALPMVDPVSGDTFAAPMIMKQGPKLDYKSSETLADTTARFNALFAAIGEWGGGRVKRGEYAVDRLSLDADFELELDQDAVLDFSGATTAGHGLMLGNTTFVDLPALTADLVEGTYTATFASVPDVAKGDWIIAHDPTPYGWLAEANGGRTYYQSGERLRVADVVGPVVTFDAPILHSYAYAGLKMYKPAVRRIRLAGGHFVGRIEESADNSLIVAQNIQNGYFSFLAKTAERAILDLRHPIDTDVVGIAATDYGPSVSLNYGISVMAGHKVNIIRPKLRTRRHAVSITGGSILAPIPNRYVYVKDAFLSGDSLAFDSHGAAEFIGIIDSTIEGGAVLGGDHTDIKGCLIRTLRAGTNAGVGISLRERRGMNVNIDKTDVYTATALAADQYVIDMAGPAAAQESGAVRMNARIVTQLAQQRLVRVMGGAAIGKYLDVAVKVHVDAPTGTADGQCYFDTSTAAQAWRNAEVDLSGAIQLAATNPLNATALKHLSKIRTSATAAQAINRAQEITFERGATITIPQTLLSMQAGSRLDMNGGKVAFTYSDTSNATNFLANDVSNGTVEIAEGCNIHRLFRFDAAGAKMRDVIVRSVVPIENGNDNQDAAIRVYGDDFSARNITLENLAITFRITGKNASLENVTFKGCARGISAPPGTWTGTLYAKNIRWFGCNGFATTDPGFNAFGGNFMRAHVDGFYIGPSEDLTTWTRGAGEHGVYFPGPGKLAEGGIYLGNGRVRRTGQCGIKVKDHPTCHAFEIHVSGTSWGNSAGLNEEAFRFQRIGIVTGGALHATKEMVDGVLSGEAGYTHMFFSACDTIALLTESYAEGCVAGGVVFGIDDVNATAPHGNATIRVRHKNVGGPSVIIADNAYVNGVITVYVNTDGCPGSPVYVGTGVTWGAGAKLIVIGTYKNCGAPPPASTANVDLSGFLASNEFIPINPLRYRAVGDGVVNDTTAMQAFLTAMQAGGSAVIPAGMTFAIDPVTFAPAAPVTIFARGAKFKARSGAATTGDLIAINGAGAPITWVGGEIDCNGSRHGGVKIEGGQGHDIEFDSVQNISTNAASNNTCGLLFRNAAGIVGLRRAKNLLRGAGTTNDSYPRAVGIDGAYVGPVIFNAGLYEACNIGAIIYQNDVTMVGGRLAGGTDNGLYLNGDNIRIKGVTITGYEEPIVVSGGARTIIDNADIEGTVNSLGMENCGEVIIRNSRIRLVGPNIIRTRAGNAGNTVGCLVLQDNNIYVETPLVPFDFSNGTLTELVMRGNEIHIAWNTGGLTQSKIMQWTTGSRFLIENNDLILEDASGGAMPTGAYFWNLPTVTALSRWDNSLINRTGLNGVYHRVNTLRQQLVERRRVRAQSNINNDAEMNYGALASAPRSEGVGDAAPTSGYWPRGSMIWNEAPSASGTLGWICTAAGSPGTWKTFGSISA